MGDPDFIATFLTEASEMLEEWEVSCLQVEKTPDAQNLNDLFRRAHNLKGSAKSVGLLDFGNLVHKAEDLITKLRNNELPVTAAAISILLDCQKHLSNWIEALASDRGYCPDNTRIVQALAQFDTQHRSASKEVDLGFGFFDDSPAPAAGSNQKDIGTILMESGRVTQQQIETAVSHQNRKLGEVLVANGSISRNDLESALEMQRSSGHKPDETIRVSLRKLDSLVRLVGELSIQNAIIRSLKENNQLSSAKSSEAVDLANKITQDLQTEAMSLRMQPLEGLFQRLERVCRDIAREQGKSIEVVLKGSDVELDKSVIEKMKDPLVHILRNAVDHGIEPGTERAALGKPPVASIVIEGIQTAAHVIVKISDNGRGLNLKRIEMKAKERGLVDVNAKLTIGEIMQLIFLPGFSTAEKVSEVSGRGVGMDVVKRAVDELKGTIDIGSVEGEGTTFSIILPSTLSIVDAVLVGLGDELFAVPLQDVDEVLDLTSVKISPSLSAGRTIDLRGRVLPIAKLARFLPNQTEISAESPRIALLATHENTSVAFEVDRVAGQQAVVVRKLEQRLGEVPGFSGGTILASGDPSMIVHMPQIIKAYMATTKQEAC